VSAIQLSGVLLPADEPVRLWIQDGTISATPASPVESTLEARYIIAGFVDAHCHVGVGPHGAVSLDEAVDQARTDRDAGTLLIRDCGSPLDTRPLQAMADLPRIIRAGQHIALPKRYIPTLAVELESEDQLPAAVAEQARRGDGWVKLVGDWIDRAVGDLRPLWSDGALAKAVEVAHEHGARVTAHVFGEDAIPGLIAAGIDCLEHATGMTDDAIAAMADRGTALVPTLINIENFPGIADRATTKFPTYAAHMRALHAGVGDRVRAAIEAGVAVYAGSDAGGGINHGRIVDEIVALHRVGMSPTDAIGAASWRARRWLGMPAVTGECLDGVPAVTGECLDGVSADLLLYDADPRRDLTVLRYPKHVVLRGKLIR
jgi:imidazolonepropionase-like amidohydrolase